MNCREFLIEFEDRGALSEAALLHLKICVECQKTSGQQTIVWQMIDGLQPVAAPKNFNFLVKARIADSKPENFQTGFFPILRYVLPLCAIILLAGFVVFKTSYFSSRNAPQIVETISPQSSEEISVPVNSFAANQTTAISTDTETLAIQATNVKNDSIADKSDKQLASVKTPLRPRSAAPKKDSTDDGAGSRVLSSTPPSAVKFPIGINNSNKPIENLLNPENAKTFSAIEILSVLGIESASENGKIQVKSIKQDSSAEQSGVKIGDVIEAIDGRKISVESYRGFVEGKTLTILRGAQKIEITLGNK